MRRLARHTLRVALAAAAVVGVTTFATTPARADDPTPHLTAAMELIDELNSIAWPGQSTYNHYKTDSEATSVVWGTPGSPTTYRNISQCAPFVSEVIKHALGVDESWLFARFGSNSPYSRDYYDRFLLDLGSTPTSDLLANFTTRTTLSQVAPGDILAIKYTDQASVSSGHTAIVVETRLYEKDGDPQPEYAIKLADSTGNPHGVLLSSGDYADSRSTTTEYDGAGYGWIVVDPAADDTPAGYWWGVNEGVYRSNSIRPMLFAALTP